MLKNLTVFAMAARRMEWAAKRQELIAGNVANADTPSYLPRDVRAFEFKELVGAVATPAATVTHPRHLAAATIVAANEVETVSKPYEVAPNGNGVNIEDQMVQLNDAKGAYTMALDLFQKNLKMLRIAIGRPTGWPGGS